MRNWRPPAQAEKQIPLATQVRDEQLEEGVDDEALGVS